MKWFGIYNNDMYILYGMRIQNETFIHTTGKYFSCLFLFCLLLKQNMTIILANLYDVCNMYIVCKWWNCSKVIRHLAHRWHLKAWTLLFLYFARLSFADYCLCNMLLIFSSCRIMLHTSILHTMLVDPAKNFFLSGIHIDLTKCNRIKFKNGFTLVG